MLGGVGTEVSFEILQVVTHGVEVKIMPRDFHDEMSLCSCCLFAWIVQPYYFSG
jgi:hypothetical protein